MARKRDEHDLALIISEATNPLPMKPSVSTTPQNAYINDGLDTNTTIELGKILEGVFVADVFSAMTQHNAKVVMDGTEAIDDLRLDAKTPEQAVNRTQIAKAFSEELARGVGQINNTVKTHIINQLNTPYPKPAASPPKKKGFLEKVFTDE